MIKFGIKSLTKHIEKNRTQDRLDRDKLDTHYRYMYLKTYAKFTIYIKSQGHIFDETFCTTVCT